MDHLEQNLVLFLEGLPLAAEKDYYSGTSNYLFLD